MNRRLNIHLCPNCGSDQIAAVCRSLVREFEGESYTVPDLQFYECPVCEERIFDRDAMRKLQQYSPAYGGKVEAISDAAARVAA